MAPLMAIGCPYEHAPSYAHQRICPDDGRCPRRRAPPLISPDLARSPPTSQVPAETRALAMQQLCEWALPSVAVTPSEAFQALAEKANETRRGERAAREQREAKAAAIGAIKAQGADDDMEEEEGEEPPPSKALPTAEAAEGGGASGVAGGDDEAGSSAPAERSGEMGEIGGDQGRSSAAERLGASSSARVPAPAPSGAVASAGARKRAKADDAKLAEGKAAKQARLEAKEADDEASRAREAALVTTRAHQRCLQSRVRTELLGHDRTGSTCERPPIAANATHRRERPPTASPPLLSRAESSPSLPQLIFHS